MRHLRRTTNPSSPSCRALPPDLIAALCATGTPALVPAAAAAAPAPTFDTDAISALFTGERLADIVTDLRNAGTEFADKTLNKLSRNAPLAMACAVEMIHRLRGSTDLERALELEYRYTYRAMEHGDFLEGIRAAIIDKDRSPKWQHDLEAVPTAAVSMMLRPLGKDKLTFERESTAMQIGFIGLGNMGGPMAANLAKAGHDVRGFDVAGTTADGVQQVASAAEAATGADVVITMLPNGDILRSVAADVIPAMPSGAVLLDCSTVDVDSARDVASWTMNAYCPAPGVGPQSPSDNGYQPGFAAELMLKDLRLSQQAAEGADADTPMGAVAQALYAQFVEDEDGLGRDFSAMLPRFETRSRS